MRLILCAVFVEANLSQHESLLLCDAIWAHATGNDGIEHVTVVPSSSTVDIALFLDHTSTFPAAAARELIYRVCRASPALRLFSARITAEPYVIENWADLLPEGPPD